MKSGYDARKRKISNVSERLVRDKCTKCKKLFLAFRGLKSRDLKTCDDCLLPKPAQNTTKVHKLKKKENVNLNQKNQKENINLNPPKNLNLNLKKSEREPNDISIPKSRENVEFSSGGESLVVKNNCINTVRKSPCSFGSFSVRQKVVHGDFYFCVGDIVSLHSEGTEYYAQISVLIENEFCEKQAALIWLLPTTSRTDPSLGFDPFGFTYGPQDESFYDMKLLKFVMHPPNSFFKRFISRVPQNQNIVLGIRQKYKINSKRKN